jgi:hypothetical protein
VSLSTTHIRKTPSPRLCLGELIAIGLPAVLVLRTMQTWICRIASATTWDYGPAQLAIHVDMFRKGAALYRDFRIAPFVPLVYGPVVPALTGALAPLFGAGPMAALEAGSVLAILSTIFSAMLIFALARRVGASDGAAMLAALAFILSPIVLRWGSVYRVDMPVLACELGGIFAFAGGATAIAIALFVLSFFIKQAHAVGIATVVLYCWIGGERRRAMTLALIWLVAVAAGTALLALVYPYYLLNAFGAVRTQAFDFGAPLLFFSILIGGNAALSIFAIVSLTRRLVTDRLMLLLPIVASLHDIASCLRWGSNAYYFLPLLAALAIIAAPATDLALKPIRSKRLAAQIAIGMVIALGISLGFLLAPRAIVMSLREVATPCVKCGHVATDPWDHRALKTLRAIDGPILTDKAELKLIDSRANLQWIDLMVLTSMQQLGTFDDSALVDSIRRRRIAAFALDDEGLARSFRGRPMFWPRLREAIEANYELVPGTGLPHVMLPKR